MARWWMLRISKRMPPEGVNFTSRDHHFGPLTVTWFRGVVQPAKCVVDCDELARLRAATRTQFKRRVD